MASNMFKDKNAKSHQRFRLPGLIESKANCGGVSIPTNWDLGAACGKFEYLWTIPNGINWIKIKAWGAGGGGGGIDTPGYGCSGASGAYVEAVINLGLINLSAGDKLVVLIGRGGSCGAGDSNSNSGGGAGGQGSATYGYAGGLGGSAGPTGTSGAGGGGGAASAVLKLDGSPLILAGGGAGGNGQQDGDSGSTPAYGGGAQLSANGTSKNGQAGQRPTADGAGTGGGGGGYYGGASGVALNETGQTNPSSGGNSFTIASATSVVSTTGNSGTYSWPSFLHQIIQTPIICPAELRAAALLMLTGLQILTVEMES